MPPPNGPSARLQGEQADASRAIGGSGMIRERLALVCAAIPLVARIPRQVHGNHSPVRPACGMLVNPRRLLITVPGCHPAATASDRTAGVGWERVNLSLQSAL